MGRSPPPGRRSRGSCRRCHASLRRTTTAPRSRLSWRSWESSSPATSGWLRRHRSATTRRQPQPSSRPATDARGPQPQPSPGPAVLTSGCEARGGPAPARSNSHSGLCRCSGDAMKHRDAVECAGHDWANLCLFVGVGARCRRWITIISARPSARVVDSENEPGSAQSRASPDANGRTSPESESRVVLRFSPG